MTQSTPTRLKEKRFLERTVAVSDGVAAIAITLLVLPLVDLESPDLAAGETIVDGFRDNADALIAFAVTFVVIAVLWFGHARVFSYLERADGVVAWLNIAYLFAIVTLPFASSWLQEDGFSGGVGSFYLAVLFLASAALGTIGRHVHRHPELLTQEAREDPELGTRRGYFYAGYFLVGTAISWFWPAIAPWYMLALWPTSLVWERTQQRRATSPT